MRCAADGEAGIGAGDVVRFSAGKYSDWLECDVFVFTLYGCEESIGLFWERCCSSVLDLDCDGGLAHCE